MKTLKTLGYCVLAFAVFNTSMFTTALIIDKGLQHEQITSSATQQSEVSSTTQEAQTVATITEYSNEATQEEVTYQTPTFTPTNTEEYTVNEYMEYDPNLNGDSYSITRNSEGMKGVLTIDSQAHMQWYYYDAEGIHTN